MIKMIDLKSVISLIEIIYLKKVSCIVRETKSDKKYFVIFEGEKNFKQIKLTNKDMKMVDAFRILNV
jgi:hypothetical protein